MSKTMIKSTMVVPSKETPKDPIWLSDIDLTKRTPYVHTPMVYVYPSPKDNNIHAASSTFSKQFDPNLLVSTLSEVLVPLYPLAGRLRENDETGRIEIDCNAKGALFVQVETNYNVSDFGDFTPNDQLRNLVVPACDYSGGLVNIPLLMVQFTQFRCGGVSLGAATHHFVGDGSAYVCFLNQWARLARGVGLTIFPVFDRTKVLAARKPPQVNFSHLEFQPHLAGFDHFSSNSQQLEKTRVGMFKFSQERINALRRQATESSPMLRETKYSTFVVLAAHIWRCALKARGIQRDVVVKFQTPVNGRSKLIKGNVPQGYFANFIFNSVHICKAGEILSNPLWYAANKVEEAVTRIDDEYMRSTVDFLSVQTDIKAFASGHHTFGSPGIHVNYWKGIPFYEVDFGWGKPVFVRHGGIGSEGLCFIIPADEKGCDLFVAISLYTSHMDHFEKIIYDFDNRRARATL